MQIINKYIQKTNNNLNIYKYCMSSKLEEEDNSTSNPYLKDKEWIHFWMEDISELCKPKSTHDSLGLSSNWVIHGENWLQTPISSHKSLLSQTEYNSVCSDYSSSCSPPPKNLPNLCNPLQRALACKPLNQLWSVTQFYKWEAMIFHHKLSDLVSKFGKGPKRGFKNILDLFSAKGGSNRIH